MAKSTLILHNIRNIIKGLCAKNKTINKTEFVDRSGKPIYVGDIVQYKLGGLQKSGGPTMLKVVRNKKGVVKLAHLEETENVGWILRKNYQEYLTIIDKSGRKTSAAKV